MALPIYNPQGGSGGSFFGSIRAAASRELNKARARFWSSASTVINVYDKVSVQPALAVRNYAVKPFVKGAEILEDAGKSVAGGLKIGTAVVVIAIAFIAFLYIRPFLPGRPK